MNSTLKRTIKYIEMITILSVLGFITLYVAGSPYINYLASHGRMAVIKGAPGYPHDYRSTVSKLELIKASSQDNAHILKPELGAQYGIIQSERISLSAPLYYGDDDLSFQKGAGQYAGSSLPGLGKPILISGHDGTFFAQLEHILIGDIINITTDYGSFDYEVASTLITEARDTKAYDLHADEELLILYTCYPFGGLIGDRDGRFFVYSNIITRDN